MSHNRDGFFPKNSLIDKIKRTLNWFYEYSPINFATLTGLHHPSLPRLKGNIFLGRAGQAAADSGNGLNNEVHLLSELAAEHPRGMSYCVMGTQPLLLITQPGDLQQVLKYNEAKVDRGKLIETFTYIFGETNIFSIPSDHVWQQRRNELKHWIFTPEALADLAQPMQKIIDEYIEKIRAQDGNVPSLETFFVTFAMDIFSRSVFKTDSVSDAAKLISDTFSNALATSANSVNLILLKLASISEYLDLRSKTPPHQARVNLREILTKNFIEPNKEKLLTTENLLQKFLLSDQSGSFELLLDELSFLLLAGHETTSRWLQFTLMLLTQHPEILTKIREEISAHQPADKIWTPKDLNKMEYLLKVLKETLRLYPPVPLLPRIVTEQFVLADIPRCLSKKKYEEAFANRDTTNDIVVAPGTIILMSPFITQRLASVHENPLQFNPDRFHTDSFDPLIKAEGPYDDPYGFLPFGAGSRNCIGRQAARQEAALTLIKICDNFDFSISPELDKDAEIETTIRGTLKCKNQINMHFSKRQDATDRPQPSLG